jgi:hypothetical protein
LAVERRYDLPDFEANWELSVAVPTGMAVADPAGTFEVKLWYRTAIACGLFPMVLGTAIFAVWLFTDLDALEIIGLLFIYGGIVLFAAGIGSLLIFVSRARKGGIAYRRPTTLALAVLILNVPLCAAYISIAFAMESAHIVTVVNRAGMPIESLTLTDPAGRQFRIGTVGPGQVRHACLDFSGEGAVQFSLNVDGEARAGTLIGYLADPLGSSATLHLSAELTLQASEEFRRVSLADFLRYCVPGWRT